MASGGATGEGWENTNNVHRHSKFLNRESRFERRDNEGTEAYEKKESEAFSHCIHVHNDQQVRYLACLSFVGAKGYEMNGICHIGKAKQNFVLGVFKAYTGFSVF